jgi:divinyl protochlorophyllide a 8-vinyl-reductase
MTPLGITLSPLGAHGSMGRGSSGAPPPRQAPDPDHPRSGSGERASGPARIGPNALIQTARALEARRGRDEARRLLRLGGMEILMDEDPQGMRDEREFLSLVTFLTGVLPSGELRAVLHDAGRRTGAYVLRNRIPAPVRLLVRPLPRRLRLRLLLGAIGRNAWTFAGSGSYHFQAGDRPVVSLRHGPPARQVPTTEPLHAYYQGAIEELLRAMVAPATELEKTDAFGVNGREGVDFRIRFPNDRNTR